MSGMRMDRLNQLFKREISNMFLLGEIHDPRVKDITITYVDISKDLSYAHVGFSLLSEAPDDVQNALQGLKSASGHVRFLLGGRVDVRHIPQVKFVYDHSLADAMKMTQTFEDLHQSGLMPKEEDPIHSDDGEV